MLRVSFTNWECRKIKTQFYTEAFYHQGSGGWEIVHKKIKNHIGQNGLVVK